MVTISSGTSTRARRGRSKLSLIFTSITLTLSITIFTVQRAHMGRILSNVHESQYFFTNKEARPSDLISAKSGPERHFDCAISWLRLPKTASTSVAQNFIQPLQRAGKFTNTEVGPNTCIEGVGGCAPYWKGRRWDNRTITRKILRNNTLSGDAIPAPFYVGSEGTDQSNQRCFPMMGPTAPKISCQEYDSRTFIMNFGPHRRPEKNAQQPGKQAAEVKPKPTRIQANFDFGPMIATHVGLDPSLFGWVMPLHPMVFSTFRDPIERLISSFHYGIQFGGGRPGEVDKCDLPGAGKGKGRVDRWNARIVKAREIATLQHNWTEYQSLLRLYLRTCSMAADNAYVQFLDPYSKDVNLAISNLEKYVIVGLQTNMDETMRRWINITRRSCRSHPRYGDMSSQVFRKILTDMQINGGFDRKRESTVELKPKTTKNKLKDSKTATRALKEEDYDDAPEHNVTQPVSEIKLASPDFGSFDIDLQQLIRRLTAGDELIFKRVLELYEEQRYLGL